MPFSFSPQMMTKLGNLSSALRSRVDGSDFGMGQTKRPAPQPQGQPQVNTGLQGLQQLVAQLTQSTGQEAAQPQPDAYASGVMRPDFSNTPFVGQRFGFRR